MKLAAEEEEQAAVTLRPDRILTLIIGFFFFSEGEGGPGPFVRCNGRRGQ